MENIKQLYSFMWSDPIRIGAFSFCSFFICLCTLIKSEKNEIKIQVRNQLILPSVLLLAVVFNPISSRILLSLMEERRVFRFFWIVPVLPIIAIVAVWFVKHLPCKVLRILVAGIVPILFIGTTFQFDHMKSYWSNERQNWYKIPESVVTLCDYIENDDATTSKTVIMPPILSMWVRQYRGDIIMPFSYWRSESSIEGSEIIEQIMSGSEGQTTIDLDTLGDAASQYPFNYIVIPSYVATRGMLENYGYQLIYRVNEDYNLMNDGTDSYTSRGVYDMEYDLYCRKGTL